MNKTKTIILLFLFLTLSYLLFTFYRINKYSTQYSESKSDVAIVLGAGSKGGVVSPVFRERINHGIKLYRKELVGKIIITGGFGKGELISDSQAGKAYCLGKNIPESDIITEETSRYTIENLQEAKSKMDSMNLKTALLVSDPIHMKRSMDLAKKLQLDCKPSPTQTSMYKSDYSIVSFLFYESIFYSLGEITGKN